MALIKTIVEALHEAIDGEATLDFSLSHRTTLKSPMTSQPRGSYQACNIKQGVPKPLPIRVVILTIVGI